MRSANDNSIPKDWQKPIDALIAMLDRTAGDAFAPSPDDAAQEQAAQHHDALRLDLTSHIEEKFGSLQEFGDFLRADISGRIEGAGFSAEIVDQTADWDVGEEAGPPALDKAMKLYREAYRGLDERLAYTRSFHHAAPDFTPKI